MAQFPKTWVELESSLNLHTYVEMCRVARASQQSPVLLRCPCCCSYTPDSSIPGFCTNCFLCLECSSAGLTPSWLILLLQVFAMPHILDEAFVVVQLLSHVRLFATPWTAARLAPLSLTISWHVLKLMPMESVLPSNHLILCQPPSPLPLNLFQSQGFSSELALLIR